jgi:hypothetical protein
MTTPRVIHFGLLLDSGETEVQTQIGIVSLEAVTEDGTLEGAHPSATKTHHVDMRDLVAELRRIADEMEAHL